MASACKYKTLAASPKAKVKRQKAKEGGGGGQPVFPYR
jgi:hypothetical protein